MYPRPVTALNEIVTNLRFLTHLDISSTNLASQPSVNDRPFKGYRGFYASFFFFEVVLIFDDD